jgi:hypothetical protein
MWLTWLAIRNQSGGSLLHHPALSLNLIHPDIPPDNAAQLLIST